MQLSLSIPTRAVLLEQGLYYTLGLYLLLSSNWSLALWLFLHSLEFLKDPQVIVMNGQVYEALL